MSQALPVIYLARHGETAWTLSGQHTGLTDLPLTPAGERNARQLGQRLKGLRFAAVFTSPLQRAVRTCRLAGFGSMAKVDFPTRWSGTMANLMVYAQPKSSRSIRTGIYSGMVAHCGESPAQVGSRADRV